MSVAPTKIVVEFGRDLAPGGRQRWTCLLPLDLAYVNKNDAVVAGLELALDTARAQRDTGSLEVESDVQA